MSTPTERVREFLRQFDRLRDTGGTIHVVYADPEGEQAALKAGDLYLVLDQAEQFEQAGRAATVPLIDTRDGAPITRKDPDVIGYAVAGRDGILHHNLPRTKDEAEQLAEEWTRDLPEGLDWDYRAVAITEVPEDPSA